MVDNNAGPPIVAASLLAADAGRYREEAQAAQRAGADRLHLDVMDGHFVPNIGLGLSVVGAIRPFVTIPFDVHLMIAPADAYVAPFVTAGADHILIHAEAGPNLHRTLTLIRSLGRRPGVVLNPSTPLELAESVLGLVDAVLLMSVDPGFGGQLFLDCQLPRLARMRATLAASGRVIRLGVDGGITPETARLAMAAGADMLVAGTAIFGSVDYEVAIRALRPDTL